MPKQKILSATSKNLELCQLILLSALSWNLLFHLEITIWELKYYSLFKKRGVKWKANLSLSLSGNKVSKNILINGNIYSNNILNLNNLPKNQWINKIPFLKKLDSEIFVHKTCDLIFIISFYEGMSEVSHDRKHSNLFF